jgi:hypothetical protein
VSQERPLNVNERRVVLAMCTPFFQTPKLLAQDGAFHAIVIL